MKGNNDFGQGKDELSVKNGILIHEGFTLHGIWSLPKWDFKGDVELQAFAEKLMKEGQSFMDSFKMFRRFCIQDNTPIGENLMLNVGINIMLSLLAGGAGTVFSNANGRIGVGDSNTAAAASQTGLLASSNKTYVAYDVSFPTYGSSQTFVSRATFITSAANYAWQEFTNDNGTPTTSLNRLVSSQGTKVSGQTWQPTITITES